MSISVALIKKLTQVDPPLREVLLAILEEMEKQRQQWEESVTKTEFNELKEIVRDLGQTVKELAEAQRRTEARLEELAEAQKKTEARVNELAEAQRRTEERLNELAEAQKRTEERVDKLSQRMEELAEAQRRTEEELTKLIRDYGESKRKLEGLSDTVGYYLEDRVYRTLPNILREKGIKVLGRLIRTYVSLKGKDEQVNIYGRGKINGKEILILGEVKTRFSKKAITNFEKKARKIAESEGLEPYLLFVAYDFPPKIENFLKEKGLTYFWSYELER